MPTHLDYIHDEHVRLTSIIGVLWAQTHVHPLWKWQHGQRLNNAALEQLGPLMLQSLRSGVAALLGPKKQAAGECLVLSARGHRQDPPSTSDSPSYSVLQGVF